MDYSAGLSIAEPFPDGLCAVGSVCRTVIDGGFHMIPPSLLDLYILLPVRVAEYSQIHAIVAEERVEAYGRKIGMGNPASPLIQSFGYG